MTELLGTFLKSVGLQDWRMFPKERMRGHMFNTPCTAQNKECLTVRQHNQTS